jgi:hypothetical protein
MIEINFFAYGQEEQLPIMSNAKSQRKKMKSSSRKSKTTSPTARKRKNKKA